MATETQTYLDETKAPSIQPYAQARVAVRTCLKALGETLEQTSRSAKLLREAEFAEPDGDLQARLAEGHQKFCALMREVERIAEAGRKTANILQQLAAWDATVRQVAGPLGYTI